MQTCVCYYHILTLLGAHVSESGLLYRSPGGKQSVFSVCPVTPVCTVPVGGCGEHSQDDVPAVHPDDGAGGVQQVEVEVGITGDGAVEAGFQKWRPLLLKDTLRPAVVPFTHPGHTWHHHLWGHRVRHRDADMGIENECAKYIYSLLTSISIAQLTYNSKDEAPGLGNISQALGFIFKKLCLKALFNSRVIS